MKNILILILATVYCNAQTPVLPIVNDDFEDISGAYYKDIDNDFNKFIGTWVCSTGDATFTLVLQKKEMVYMNPYYQDVLVGGYIYKVGGNELVNTTNQIVVAPNNFFDYHLRSFAILRSFSIPKCPECEPDERRVSMSFTDPLIPDENGLRGEMVLRRITENGIPKIKARLIFDGMIMQEEGQPTPNDRYTIPFGEYVFTKVN